MRLQPGILLVVSASVFLGAFAASAPFVIGASSQPWVGPQTSVVDPHALMLNTAELPVQTIDDPI